MWISEENINMVGHYVVSAHDGVQSYIHGVYSSLEECISILKSDDTDTDTDTDIEAVISQTSSANPDESDESDESSSVGSWWPEYEYEHEITCWEKTERVASYSWDNEKKEVTVSYHSKDDDGDIKRMLEEEFERVVTKM